MESESNLHVVPMRRKRGVRTYALMVLGMAVVTLVTCLCVIIIRYRWHSQVTDELSQDLEHSVMAFQDLQAERLGALDRENSLLAELPTLKALLTSGDDLTIQDEAVDFWQLSGTDLFALADPSGRIAAVYSKTATTGPALREGLRKLLGSTDKNYLIEGGSLYACSLRPLYFGSNQEGTLLGYVISGVSIESTARQINDPTAVEATFLSAGKIVATTLSPSAQVGLEAQAALLARISRKPATVKLGNVRFLAATEDLSTSASAPLQLLVLKSLDPAERSIARINRMVLSAGLLALLCGAVLMVTVSRLVTRPLEELSNGVRAFGTGDVDHRLPRHGTLEVLELSAAFAKMRKENQHANRALLESERLATIGRMASSVSHDFRHYLATIYANSEFLLRDKISSKERAEFFADIRTAVLGSLDMIESLLMFGRTGASKRRTAESMVTLLDRAVALIRTHPDGDGVRLETRFGDPSETGVIVDGKQVERAIFNLLLNACQAAHCAANDPHVLVTLEVRAQHLTINVIDNGVGVPEIVRKSLFEPFVSEGKQKGTGLGLTLANCIASEHGGEVSLVSSRSGETIFQMKIARDLRSHYVSTVLDSGSGLAERGESVRI